MSADRDLVAADLCRPYYAALFGSWAGKGARADPCLGRDRRTEGWQVGLFDLSVRGFSVAVWTPP